MTISPTVTISTPTDRDVVMTRVFNAPRALVFDALTKPDLLKRWYGPRGWTLTVCEIDLRVGGAWRFVVTRPDGKAVGQYGAYREVASPDKLVNTERWEDWDPGETLVTTVLTDQPDGTTLLTTTTRFPSREVRDTVLKSGMEPGAVEHFDKLAALLAAM